MCAMPSITQITGLLEIITMQLQKFWKNYLFVKLKMGMVAVASDWPELNPLNPIPRSTVLYPLHTVVRK